MAEEGFKVTLNVYDLSQGLARQLSTTLLGKAIEAVWHTGIVVYGREYYFSGGIVHDPVGRTPYGTPIRTVELGVTHVPREVFEDYLKEIGSRYTAETYNLLTHNCNNFSNEVAQFLVGASIPDYILQLPNEVMSSPMGALMVPMLQQLESTLKSGAVPRPPQFVPPASHPPLSKANPATTLSGMSVSSTLPKIASPPSSKPSTKPEPAPASDALGEARAAVQEEITREFASIMATGTLRASEAAALAARRVMEKHKRLGTRVQQG